MANQEYKKFSPEVEAAILKNASEGVKPHSEKIGGLLQFQWKEHIRHGAVVARERKENFRLAMFYILVIMTLLAVPAFDHQLQFGYVYIFFAIFLMAWLSIRVLLFGLSELVRARSSDYRDEFTRSTATLTAAVEGIDGIVEERLGGLNSAEILKPGIDALSATLLREMLQEAAANSNDLSGSDHLLRRGLRDIAPQMALSSSVVVILCIGFAFAASIDFKNLIPFNPVKPADPQATMIPFKIMGLLSVSHLFFLCGCYIVYWRHLRTADRWRENMNAFFSAGGHATVATSEVFPTPDWAPMKGITGLPRSRGIVGFLNQFVFQLIPSKVEERTGMKINSDELLHHAKAFIPIARGLIEGAQARVMKNCNELAKLQQGRAVDGIEALLYGPSALSASAEPPGGLPHADAIPPQQVSGTDTGCSGCADGVACACREASEA